MPKGITTTRWMRELLESPPAHNFDAIPDYDIADMFVEPTAKPPMPLPIIRLRSLPLPLVQLNPNILIATSCRQTFSTPDDYRINISDAETPNANLNLVTHRRLATTDANSNALVGSDADDCINGDDEVPILRMINSALNCCSRFFQRISPWEDSSPECEKSPLSPRSII